MNVPRVLCPIVCVAGLVLTMRPAMVLAQQTPAAPATRSAPASPPAPAVPPPAARSTAPGEDVPVPVKLQVVITRLQNDAVVSRLPFTLWANANADRRASASLGIQVPLRDASGVVTYHNVGTSIRYKVSEAPDGWYKLEMLLSDTPLAEGNDAAAVPILKSLSLENVLYLKEGQPVELASTTDSTNGEVARVEFTVTRLR